MNNRPTAPACTQTCISTKKVKAVKEELEKKSDLFEWAEKFKVLANETRLKIIFALSFGELCVCEIAEVLGLSIPATSQQLKILRQQGHIGFRIDGKIVYYFLKDKRLPSLIQTMVQRLFDLN